MNIKEEQAAIKPLRFGQNLIILSAPIAILSLMILGLRLEPHIPLITAVIVTSCLLLGFGRSWSTVKMAIMKGLQACIMPAVLLSLIGVLQSVWMMSGTIPTLLFYGISGFQPQWFTLSALLLTIIVSMFVGTSIMTISTFGVALTGMAESMGISPAIVAGAVVSGAYFGDKMSPLSETTRFASAIARVSVLDHICNMTKTTVPSLLITCCVFLFFGSPAQSNIGHLQAIQHDINSVFHIDPLALSPFIIVLIAACKRLPIVVTMLLGIAMGLLVTTLIQGNIDVLQWVKYMQNGFQDSFKLEEVGRIINRGGLQSMIGAISLIVTAFTLGGLLQHTGVIETVFQRIIVPIKSKEALIVTSGLSSIGVNIITGEQYMSILLPGQLFKDEYEKRGIPRTTLSRTLEDCGTLVNPLIPWGISGAMITSALSVTVLDYFPYAFFPLVSLLVSFAVTLVPKLKHATLGTNKK